MILGLPNGAFILKEERLPSRIKYFYNISPCFFYVKNMFLTKREHIDTRIPYLSFFQCITVLNQERHFALQHPACPLDTHRLQKWLLEN